MKKEFIMVGLTATLIVTSSLIPLKSYALTDRERSAQICNNPPKSSNSQQTLDSKPANADGYRIRVELRSSNQSRAKWVRACVPQGTVLYLKDESGKRYAPYTTQVNGWNYGDQLNTRMQLKACAEYPGVRELCTDAR